jgi:hypothetical protein
VIRPWLWAADNHTIGNRSDGDGGLLSLADILDMSSSQEPGSANRAQKQRPIAAASVAGAEACWPRAEEADLVVPAKPVFLNAILARNEILQTVPT